jgi:hypothetical protein
MHKNRQQRSNLAISRNRIQRDTTWRLRRRRAGRQHPHNLFVRHRLKQKAFEDANRQKRHVREIVNSIFRPETVPPAPTLKHRTTLLMMQPSVTNGRAQSGVLRRGVYAIRRQCQQDVDAIA